MGTEKKDFRRAVLETAQRKLGKVDVSETQREQLKNLLDLLMESIQALPETSVKEKAACDLARNLVDQHALLSLLQQKTAELDAIKKISLSLTSSLELSQVLAKVVGEAMQLVPNARKVHIYLYQGGKLKLHAALNSNGSQEEQFPEPRRNGFTYTVARKAETIIVKDRRSDPIVKGTAEDLTGSIIGIPMIMGTRVFGVMTLARQAEGGFSESEIRLLTLLAEQAVMAIVNARLHQVTSQQARSDILTGLPNRRALDERLEEEISYALATDRPMAVVMMDLDGFKSINDSFGHHVGDRVLREAFVPLAQVLRDTDFLARYGGDELTLVLHETSLEAAQTVIQKVQEKIHSIRITLPDKSKAVLELSGGLAVFPTHGQSAAELMRAADQALYRAKKMSRGNILMATSYSDT